MYFNEVNSSYQLEGRTEGGYARRKRGLDWHLAGLSLIIAALLNWSGDAQASAGSVLESQGNVARAKVGPVTTKLVDTGRVRIVFPSAPKSRTEALVPQQTLNLSDSARERLEEKGMNPAGSQGTGSTGL